MMQSRHIHITGASGSGTTTVGRALADALAIPHHDTDDYFWTPTTPSFQQKRDAADRLRLMGEMFLPRAEWVLSGSLSGWGDPLVRLFDLVVFLIVPAESRVQRLRERETRRFGADAVAPGGWRHEETEEFVAWASGYDEGRRVSRNLAAHEEWLAKLPCPVLRLDGARPVHELVAEIVIALHAVGTGVVRDSRS
jgi:adenylate kinase family enzyme